MKVSFTYLLTFIFILGLTANSFPSSGKGDDAKVLHEKTFKISPGKKLLVNAASGDVQITAWDKSEVYVKVIGNDNAADKFDFSFNANSEEVKVDAEKKDGWSWFSNIKLKFEIKVPANFNVYTNTSGGDIKIGGVKGGITLKTSGGDIWGDRFEGNFNAKTSGGDITLFCSNAKIDANTSGGDIDIEYMGTNKGIELKTSGGDIKIKVPQNIDADVDLRTSGGDVECNMNLNNVKRLSDSKIIGSLNKGGVPLNAHTSGGDITLSRK
ncbi:MAG: DUF4097 family beta strand repeat-containing protein [Ignavibacteriaceae bacterium]